MSKLACCLCLKETNNKPDLDRHILENHSDISTSKDQPLKRNDAEEKELSYCYPSESGIIDFQTLESSLIKVQQEAEEDPLNFDFEETFKMETSDDEETNFSSEPVTTDPFKLDLNFNLNSEVQRNPVQDKAKLDDGLKIKILTKRGRKPSTKNLKNNSTEIQNLMKTDLIQIQDSKMVKCDRCDYKSLSKASFDLHFRMAHMKAGKFLCTACGKRYFDQRDLSNHVEKNNITTPDGVWQMVCSKFRKVASNASEDYIKEEQSGEVRCLKCNYTSNSSDLT